METLVIKFNAAEMAFIESHALAIQTYKRGRGIPAGKMDFGKKQLAVEIVGIKGEAAVAKHLGVKIDRSIHDEGDGGRDLTWQGRTIQVKSSFPADTLHLLVNDSDSLQCDYLVFVVTDETAPAARIYGWIKTVDFLQSATIKNMGHGDRMALPVDKLHPITTLGENADDDLLWDDVASKRRDIVITPEFFDTWQERSAIMENDGKVSRARADLESFKELTTRRKK
jgi:hypothetical protein